MTVGGGGNGPSAYALWDQLPPTLRQHLEESPPEVQKPVVDLEARLVEQVQSFVDRRVNELESFAESEIRKHAELVAWRDNVRRSEEKAALKPKLKSIVKHHSSGSSEKRVSFSDSPPQVEVFETDDNEDEGHVKGSKDSDSDSDSSEHTLPPEDEPESVVYHHAPFVAKPKHDLANVPIKPDKAVIGSDPIFSFDDLITHEDDEAHKSERSTPEKSSPELSSAPEIASPQEQGYVGSLPIDISTGHMRRNIDTRESIPEEIDPFAISPERMSFSQRMVWENQKST